MLPPTTRRSEDIAANHIIDAANSSTSSVFPEQIQSDRLLRAATVNVTFSLDKTFCSFEGIDKIECNHSRQGSGGEEEQNGKCSVPRFGKAENEKAQAMY
jgi:hypothetical protein